MTVVRRKLLYVTGTLGLLVVSGAGALSMLGEKEAVYAGPVRPVERGPMTISVSESGTVEAREKVVLKCEVDERSTTITYIVPEGTWVEEGDLLVELDASVLQDELYDEEIDMLDTEAERIAAQEDLAVVRNQAQADLSAAQLALRFAKEDLNKYVKGDYPKQLMEASNRVTLSEEELAQAQDTLEWSLKIADKGFLSEERLKQDRLATQRAEIDLELAKTEKELLEKYTHGRQLAQLEADVEQAELALERVERKAKADVAQAESNLRRRELQYKRQSAQFEDIQTQVEKCEIFAPVSGMAIYATTGRDRRDDDEPLEVGREVREQEELIHIPTADAKSARIKVHESALEMVTPGLVARITVDALPGRVFRGRVARISPLPDAQNLWLNPDLKVYDTEVHLEGPLDGLRTGMTCRAELVIQEYEDALQVPVHAVVHVDGEPTVWVVEAGEPVPRAVEVGLDNNRMVHVLAGLDTGETVALAPPLEEGEKRDALGGPRQDERAATDRDGDLEADAGGAAPAGPATGSDS